MRIVLMRHGATEWSVTGQHTGRTDLPLIQEGRDEAAGAAALLRSLVGSVDRIRIVSSPLQRAFDTARLVTGRRDIELSDDLMELDYGSYEGQTALQIRHERPGWDLWIDGCPQGETIEAAGRRADRFLAWLASTASSGAGAFP